MKRIKKFRDYEEEFDGGSKEDRRHRLSEKRLRSALKSKDYSKLIDIEEDYI